jgi:hypothetical protein
LTSDLNLTPRVTDEVSESLGVVGVAVAGQIVQAEHAVADGVTAFEAWDAGPVPAAFVAATVKVYVVPLVRPLTVAVVAGGLPVTVVGVCAVVPMNGVTV